MKHISKTLKDHLIKAQLETRARAVPAITKVNREPAVKTYEEALTDVDPDDSEPETATTKEQRRWYRLMYRRFGHCGPDMLRKIHKVISLQNPIKIPPPRRKVCAPCKLAKMRNLTRTMLSKHKLEKLELVYLDVAGPFQMSLRGNKYFLQIVDSATRRTWSLPLPSKDGSIDALRSWQYGRSYKQEKELRHQDLITRLN